MKKSEFLLFKKLTEACGISGREDEIRDIISDELMSPSFIKKTDSLGNLIVSYCSDSSLPNIAFFAHIDEVGFIISNILDNGFLKIKPIGGRQSLIPFGQKVIIQTSQKEKFFAVINCANSAFFQNSGRKQVLDDVYLDAGFTSKQAVLEAGISIGDSVIPYSLTESFRNNLLIGKAFDDRICAFSAILALKEILRKNINANITVVFTTQEEIGCRGAKTAAYSTNPDLAFAIDVTDSFDTPDLPIFDCKIGNGVALSFADSGTIAHNGLIKFIHNLFTKKGIQHTFDPMDFGGTDSSQIHINDSGILNLTISLPIRYMHSFYSVASFKDIETLKNAIITVIKNVRSHDLEIIRESKYISISKN